MRPLLFIIALFLLMGTSAYAFEPVPITLSNTMDKVIFDGKWTFEYEWKASSYNAYNYDGNNTQIVLRSAHQGNFVYVFLDAVTDSHPDPTTDYAIICFDLGNDKSDVPKTDDYCFKDTLDGKEGSTYQGNPASVENSHFSIVPNPAGFVGSGSISDENDRYTAIPHPSYEFRIPTSLIGRDSTYGFYFLVHDGNSNKSYAYPTESPTQSFVPSPREWGEIYSPDKSLPEFELPLLLLPVSVLPVILLFKLKRFGKLIK